MHGKNLLGYQGWFSCPDDDSDLNNWHHWFRKTDDQLKPTFEMWPDLSEFDVDELYKSPIKMPDGKPAQLFSSYNEKTVARHFQWMEDAGIDGILLQRFIGEVQDPRYFKFRNQVTQNVFNSAEKYGRVFALEYDMSVSQIEFIKKDWIFLVDNLEIIKSERYLRHNEKPVLGLWGIGFTHRKGSANQAKKLLALSSSLMLSMRSAYLLVAAMVAATSLFAAAIPSDGRKSIEAARMPDYASALIFMVSWIRLEAWNCQIWIQIR